MPPTAICELYALGSNSHGQLEGPYLQQDNVERKTNPDYSLEFKEFEKIWRADNLDLVFAGWSQTVVYSDEARLTALGEPFRITSASESASDSAKDDAESKEYTILEAPTSFQAIGTHDGILAILNAQTHELHLAPRFSPHSSTRDPPKLATLATTPAGWTVCAFFPAPGASTTHLVSFSTPQRFLAWYQDPSDPLLHPRSHHQVPGRPVMLVGNAVGFALLTQVGEVFSWTYDPRFAPALGRNLEATKAALEPGVVEGLSGLGSTKVVAGPWAFGALTGGNEVYVWGRGKPVERGVIDGPDGWQGDQLGLHGSVGEVIRLVESGDFDWGEERGSHQEGEDEVVDLAIANRGMWIVMRNGDVWCFDRPTSMQKYKPWDREDLWTRWNTAGDEDSDFEGKVAKRIWCSDAGGSTFVLVEGESD